MAAFDVTPAEAGAQSKSSSPAVAGGGSIKVSVLTLMLATAAYARPQIDPKIEMITSAEVIAIVEIDKVEATQTHAALALYRQRAHAKVERVVKGTPRILGDDLPLFGDEQQLLDAHTHLSPGRFLAFLKVDTVREDSEYVGPERSARTWQGIYAGANGYPSLRPIHGDMVQWYADDHYAKEISTSLQSVLDEIQTVLAASAMPDARGGSPMGKK